VIDAMQCGGHSFFGGQQSQSLFNVGNFKTVDVFCMNALLAELRLFIMLSIKGLNAETDRLVNR